MAWTDERLEKRFDGIDRRFDAVDRRFEEFNRNVNHRFDEVDRRLGEMDSRFDRLEDVVGGLQGAMLDLHRGLYRGAVGVIIWPHRLDRHDARPRRLSAAPLYGVRTIFSASRRS